jgi:hypothetical protein
LLPTAFFSSGLSRRFVPYNGAVGRVQLDWLSGHSLVDIQSHQLTCLQQLWINAVKTEKQSSSVVTFRFSPHPQSHRACCGISKTFSTSSKGTTVPVFMVPAELCQFFLDIFMVEELSAIVESFMYR